MNRRLLPIAGVLALAAGALTACGGGEDGGLADLAPPDVPLYAEVSVRPDSDTREAIASFAANLGEPDAGARLTQGLDGLLADNDVPVRFADDIEPWLGERAGLFVLSLEPSEEFGLPDFALLAEVADEDAAQAFIDRVSEIDTLTGERTYGGYEYIGGSGEALGMIDDVFVLGSEAALKVAIDAKDGESLAASDEYADRVDALGDDPLVSVFAEVGMAVDAAIAAGEIPPVAGGILHPLFAGGIAGPLVAGVELTSAGADVDFVTSLDDTDAIATDSSLLESLPGSSVLAVALPSLGDFLIRTIDQVETSGIPGAAGLQQQLEAETGVDLGEDVAGWLGDVSGFLAGTPEDGSFGVLAETNDPEGPRELLEGAQRLIEREQPQAAIGPAPEGFDYGFSVGAPTGTDRLEVGVSGTEVVASLGASAAEVSGTDHPLADDALYQQATDALGSDYAPNFYAALPGLLPFAQAGGVDEGRDYAKAIPYFEALGYLIAGSRVDGDLAIARLAVGNE